MCVSQIDIEDGLGRRLRGVEEDVITEIFREVIIDELNDIIEIKKNIQDKISDFINDKNGLNHKLRVKTGWKK